MKIILLDKVANLGTVGSEVDVKAGYARNYLLPKKIAVLATPENRAKFEAQRAELEAAAAAKLAEAKAVAEKVKEVGTICIAVATGSEGRLFGSVTNRDIVEVFQIYGIEIPRSAVRIPNTVIREIGEHKIVLHLHSEVNVEVTIEVQSDH